MEFSWVLPQKILGNQLFFNLAIWQFYIYYCYNRRARMYIVYALAACIREEDARVRIAIREEYRCGIYYICIKVENGMAVGCGYMRVSAINLSAGTWNIHLRTRAFLANARVQSGRMFEPGTNAHSTAHQHLLALPFSHGRFYRDEVLTL